MCDPGRGRGPLHVLVVVSSLYVRGEDAPPAAQLALARGILAAAVAVAATEDPAAATACSANAPPEPARKSPVLPPDPNTNGRKPRGSAPVVTAVPGGWEDPPCSQD